MRFFRNCGSHRDHDGSAAGTRDGYIRWRIPNGPKIDIQHSQREREAELRKKPPIMGSQQWHVTYDITVKEIDESRGMGSSGVRRDWRKISARRGNYRRSVTRLPDRKPCFAEHSSCRRIMLM